LPALPIASQQSGLLGQFLRRGIVFATRLPAVPYPSWGQVLILY